MNKNELRISLYISTFTVTHRKLRRHIKNLLYKILNGDLYILITQNKLEFKQINNFNLSTKDIE
jgi:hypothetical protein